MNGATGCSAPLRLFIVTASAFVKVDVNDRAEGRGGAEQAEQDIQTARHPHRLHQSDHTGGKEPNDSEADHRIALGAAGWQRAPNLRWWLGGDWGTHKLVPDRQTTMMMWRQSTPE